LGNLRIIYMGNGKRGVMCLKELLDAGKNIVLVVVHPEGYDKHATRWDETVKSTAQSHDLPIFAPEKINTKESIAALREYHPELIILGGYGQIIRRGVLDIPEHGILNLHGGPLPRYRGSSPINWSIINGETRSACTVIFVDKGIDTGDIAAQQEFAIGPDDTALTIQKRTFEIFPKLLLQVVDDIENGTVTRTPQDESQAFYYHKRTPRDGKLDWNSMTARQVHDMVRALTHPYPGTFTFFRGKKLFIWKASLLEQDIRGVPGRVCFRRKGGVIVIAGDRGLLIETVQEEGKEEMNARDYFTKTGVDLG